MKISYFVETPDSVVVNWFKRLGEAKAWAEAFASEFTITKVVGQHWHEGRHVRTLEFLDGKYKVVNPRRRRN